MSAFELALVIYRDGRIVIEATRELAVIYDEVRWAREDLEDVLLDLKLAVLEVDGARLGIHLRETSVLLAEIRRLLRDLPDEE